MDDDMRERLAEELRSTASDMLRWIVSGDLDEPAVDQWREKILSVAFELDPRDERQRATGR